MSWLASEWAEDAPVADTYERIILSALARKANDDGTVAYPSVATMARAALCDARTVQRRLKAMLDRGLIQLGNQSAVEYIRVDNRPVVYDLLIPFDWYSAKQRSKVDAERAERKLPPLTPDSRPPIPEPSLGRKERHDKGVPRPHRRRDATTSEDPSDGLVVTPSTNGPGAASGLLVTPLEGDGVTSSPVNGVTSSPEAGCLVVTQTSPIERTDPQPTNQGGGAGADASASSPSGWLVGDRTSTAQPTDTPGALFLALLPARYMPDQHAVARLVPKIDTLLGGGWTSSELLHRLTDGTRDVDNPVGVLIRRLDGLLPRPATRPRPGRFTPDQAEAEVARLARCSQTGAEKAARLLGTQWVEPHRGWDEDAKSYLLGKLPAAARAYVEQHHDELVSVLTGANTTTKGAAS